MKHRNPAGVFFLSIITIGIYSIVWHVKTKNEMNRQGAQIPTAWLLIIPFVNWYWLWKYSEGVEHVTGGQMSGVLAFVLLFLLGIIGMAILQSEYNKIGEAPLAQAVATPGTAVAPTVPSGPLPDNSFGGPQAQSPQTVPPMPPAPTQSTPPSVGGSGNPTTPGQPQPPQSF